MTDAPAAAPAPSAPVAPAVPAVPAAPVVPAADIQALLADLSSRVDALKGSLDAQAKAAAVHTALGAIATDVKAHVSAETARLKALLEGPRAILVGFILGLALGVGLTVAALHFGGV